MSITPILPQACGLVTAFAKIILGNVMFQASSTERWSEFLTSHERLELSIVLGCTQRFEQMARHNFADPVEIG